MNIIHAMHAILEFYTQVSGRKHDIVHVKLAAL